MTYHSSGSRVDKHRDGDGDGDGNGPVRWGPGLGFCVSVRVRDSLFG